MLRVRAGNPFFDGQRTQAGAAVYARRANEAAIGQTMRAVLLAGRMHRPPSHAVPGCGVGCRTDAAEARIAWQRRGLCSNGLHGCPWFATASAETSGAGVRPRHAACAPSRRSRPTRCVVAQWSQPGPRRRASPATSHLRIARDGRVEAPVRRSVRQASLLAIVRERDAVHSLNSRPPGSEPIAPGSVTLSL